MRGEVEKVKSARALEGGLNAGCRLRHQGPTTRPKSAATRPKETHQLRSLRLSSLARSLAATAHQHPALDPITVQALSSWPCPCGFVAISPSRQSSPEGARTAPSATNSDLPPPPRRPPPAQLPPPPSLSHMQSSTHSGVFLRARALNKVSSRPEPRPCARDQPTIRLDRGWPVLRDQLMPSEPYTRLC